MAATALLDLRARGADDSKLCSTMGRVPLRAPLRLKTALRNVTDSPRTLKKSHDSRLWLRFGPDVRHLFHFFLNHIYREIDKEINTYIYIYIYIYIFIKGSLEVPTSDYTESCR